VTTFVGFAPSPNQLFQFQLTLDGQPYNLIVTWSLYGQRWYFNIYSLAGPLVLAAALIGSPPNYDINLVSGYFKTSTLVFRASTQQFEVNP
jgi:hypothetical protein